MIERSEPSDIIDDFDLWAFRGGFNFKPTSFLVVKIDAGYVRFESKEFFAGPAWGLGSQVAVAF